MDKELFEGIKSGFREAIDHARGKPTGIVEHRLHAPESVDVKAIRAQLGLTQEAFANTFGFSHSNVKQWESGHRNPTKSARILLRVIERQPGAVIQALSE